MSGEGATVNNGGGAQKEHQLVAAVVAICDNNRGIGVDGGLPWPYLKEDHDFYLGLCKTTKDPNKKNGIITGSNGWRKWSEEKRRHPNMAAVVTSQTLPLDEPDAYGVVRSFDEAMQLLQSGPGSENIENIYILGGRHNYEHSVTDPRCKRLILTRVFKEFDCDIFFPEYQHAFHIVSHPDIKDDIRTDAASGIQFRFEVWDKPSSSSSPS